MCIYGLIANSLMAKNLIQASLARLLLMMSVFSYQQTHGMAI